MYNTTVVKIVEMKSGNIGIETPFNEAFKDELKALVPSAKWQAPHWIINPSGLDQAKKLLAKYYPTEDLLQKVRIKWELDHDPPEIDGVALASVYRDWWSWRNNCPINFKVVTQGVATGGSHKNPGLYGPLIIEAKIRPGAKIYPSAEVTILEDGETFNPLASFSDDELLVELARRGIRNE